MFDVQGYFQEKLVDLGEVESSFRGIWMPEPEVGAEKAGITDQFLSGAEAYHNRYSDAQHWLELFSRAFREVEKPQGAGLKILDIGTGSGVNTVVPCLQLFPECTIVATDFSAPLLRILRSYLVKSDLGGRVACVCTDAMRTQLVPESFDIVVGGAILHHLIHPELALEAGYRALKKGGLALFFEPFEGYAIIRIAFELILARAERDRLSLPEPLAKLMKAMVLDLSVRSGSDKSAPIYRELDDKWLFTRTYLERVRKAIGYSSLTISPIEYPGAQYRLATEGLMKVGAGLTIDAMPDWAWEYIDKFDRGFSRELKREVALECAIGLRK